MITKTKTTIAVLAAAILICTNYAQAGSTKPNPEALAKAARTTDEASAVVSSESRALLGRLAKGGEFAKQFDQAVYKKDKKELTRLIQEGGMKKSKVTIESIESDLRIRITGCFHGFCVTITISW
jgi:DMSO/TMAO reductase YedYZ molybdopterin-dependent catalytic subunit